jgi:hypothetical protein
MIRRYSLAVVGVLLMATLLSAIVRVAPWTLRFVDRSDSYGADIVMHKLVGAIGLVIVMALVGFMALGERMGIIKPPTSDAISLLDNDRSSHDKNDT